MLLDFPWVFSVTQPTGKISQGDDVAPVMRGKDLGHDSPRPQCFICRRPGHEAADCWWKGKKRCYVSDRMGHEAKDCRKVTRVAGEGEKLDHKAEESWWRNRIMVSGMKVSWAKNHTKPCSARCLSQARNQED